MQMQKPGVQPEVSILLIWWMFLVSIVLLGVVAYLARPLFAGTPQPQGQTVSTTLVVSVVLGVGVALVSFWLFQFRKRAKQDSLSDPKLASPKFLRRLALQALCLALVNFVLNEVVAIIGVILAILEGDPIWFWPFGAVALVLSLLMYPKRKALYPSI
ncbi:MAG: hypothetical protein GX589_09715 [Deltaproteobacteria bacterium]|nr:hypothetical protein [Deltaproteobacteria bacterium]